MIYNPKTITITVNDLKVWSRTFENKELIINDSDRVIVPGLCVWSYAHQDWNGWVAVGLDIKFSKPIYTGETITFSGEVIKKTDCYCHRQLKITVENEIRQVADLKCMPLN